MRLRTGLLVTLGFALCTAARAGEITVRNHLSEDTLLRIGLFAFPGGKALNLTVGIGSSAFRHPSDPPNVLWTLGDRGPNIACDEMKAIAGVEPAACGEVRGGRVYPTPSYTPSIYRVLLMDGADRKVVFQGVHQMMGSDLGAKWGPGEKKQSKLVFIGIDLPMDILRQGLEQCLV